MHADKSWWSLVTGNLLGPPAKGLVLSMVGPHGIKFVEFYLKSAIDLLRRPTVREGTQICPCPFGAKPPFAEVVRGAARCRMRGWVGGGAGACMRACICVGAYVQTSSPPSPPLPCSLPRPPPPTPHTCMHINSTLML